MSERRKRRSLWDKEAETNHFSGTSENNYWTGKEHHSSHDSEQYHEFSASGSHRAPKFRDHFGQPSLESLEEDPVASMNGSYIRSRENAPEGKELGGENRYYQRMSPGLKNNHSLGNDRSHSHRYPGRGRSRSRSRSRTRGRSRSRSLSRGRERERERERVRGRSRSRSRSRDDDSARGQRSWINRTDHGHISRHSYSSRGPRSELRDDVSDPYYGEDDQFQSKSRNAVPCKDFMKGNCRWGDSCRFSHHFASDGTFSKGTKYSSFDKDAEQQPPYKSGKPLCKYFAAGKCDRSNCRFSHEDSKYNGLEVREGKVTDDDSLNRRGSKRNGSTRNDATRITDNMKHSGWNESFVTLTNNIDDNTNAKNDIRFSHDLGNENINWGIPERRESLIDRDNLPSPPAGSGTYGRDLGTAEYIGRKNMAKDQELLMMHGSKLHNLAGDLNVKGQNKLQVDERFSMKPWQNVPQVPNIQQHGHGVVENNPVNSFRPDVHDEVKDSRIGAEPIPPSGQNLTQIGENVFPGLSSNPNKSDIGQSMPCPNPSDLFRSDLSGPGTHLIANLDLQSLMQNHQKAIQMTGMLKTKVQEFFPNSETSEHSAQFTNPLISITDQQIAPVKNPIMFTSQGFENEHSRKDVDIQVPHPVGMVPSFPDAGLHVPLVETTNLQPNSVRGSHDPVYPMDNDRGTNEHGNNAEQDNQMQVGRSSALSIAGVEPDNSKADHSGRPELKQDTVLANSEEDEGKRVIDEESEGVKNNKHSETDGHGKTEESNANKDDKGMRLFKNSLIEFVKDILKPTWKEGRMSREVHKTIVKKVVDKVTSTIQVDHIPKTQEKVEQYLSYSKPKIAKLIQAYVGRSLKTDS